MIHSLEPEHSCSWYSLLPDGSIRCLLCPVACIIAPNKRGFCGVRVNRSGQLLALGYGVVSALALDPIEKKPLARYFPGSTILSVGGYGCNLSCKFCQNHAISRDWLEGIDSPDYSIVNLPGSSIISPQDLVIEAQSLQAQGNIGIAFTYNEPTINFEYVRDTAILAKKDGLRVVLVTNGYINPEPLAEILPFIDAMNIDLKSFSDSFYRKICEGSINPIKRTIELVAHAGPHCHLEVTTLVIPGINSEPSEIKGLASWLAGLSPQIPLHLSRHHPAWKMLTPDSIGKAELYSLADIAREHLQYVYCGNV